ncbi:MAG TPA: response regulator [Myxococcota bacterium]|nr:response regulator [Myxococcota bacterium]
MARILVVDDSVSMRKLVGATLTDAGHEVTEASDGCEALEIAKKEEADLVITDVNMPNMDGITLVGELRNVPAYKFVPILVLTTEVGDAKKQEAKGKGATGWLVKPFDPEKLLATMKKVLG